MKNEPARRRLARIRCLLDSIKRMENEKNLPLPLCFVASEVEYSTVEGRGVIPVRKKPLKDAEKLGEISSAANIRVFASGDEYVNNHGSWLKLTQVGVTYLMVSSLVGCFVHVCINFIKKRL